MSNLVSFLSCLIDEKHNSQHAIFADLVPFSLTLGCSKYELRYWNQCNMKRFCEILAKWHLIINQIPKTIFRNMIFSNMKFIKFHGIPWNSMELQKSSMEFHGTREYGKSSMEFHGTLDLDKIPWNSMEFHGTPGVVQMLFKKFHGTLEELFDQNKFQWALKRDFEWYFDS